ncbi:hypothetical protein B296_00044515 [Ensete ventricosum]|uniref:Uncharacterized protein n=1 Tax=Ensete ventricosum TaxID=4639 RepID=A0A426YMR7_ENSVE|nr:hypothetical protein B296_00044515 [Ensete ventricosum]
MMTLNRIESFYAFLLHFRSKGSTKEGRPATASPHVGSAAYGHAVAKAPFKGGRLAAAKTSSQGRPAASRDSACGQKMPASGCRPWPALPPVGVAAPWQSDCRWARAAAAYTGAAATVQRGQEGLGHPF